MKFKHLPLLGMTLAALITGCQDRTDNAAQSPATEQAAATVTPPPPPRPVALKAADVSVTLELQSPPSMNAQNRLEIPVKITNNGKNALSTSGPGVRLGTQIAGIDGQVGSEGTVRDFVRTEIPTIEPGQSAVVVALIPVDKRVDGRKLNLELVQEGVAWFSKLGQTGVEVGPVTICDGKLCVAGQDAAADVK